MNQTCSCSNCAATPRPPSALPEARTATHDGYIWPLSRPAMSDPSEIRRRMAEDVRRLIRHDGAEAVTAEDMVRLGWLTAQVKSHGAAAVRLATEEGPHHG